MCDSAHGCTRQRCFAKIDGLFATIGALHAYDDRLNVAAKPHADGQFGGLRGIRETVDLYRTLAIAKTLDQQFGGLRALAELAPLADPQVGGAMEEDEYCDPG